MAVKSSQRQSLVNVAGVDSPWMTKTGGETSSEVSKVYPGGSKTPDIFTTPPVTSNVIISRSYDPDRDAPIVTRLRPLIGNGTFTVTVQDTDRDLIATGLLTTYSNAMLVRMAEPNYDANNGEPKIIELEFAVTVPA